MWNIAVIADDYIIHKFYKQRENPIYDTDKYGKKLFLEFQLSEAI
jgi:hypothetical protein